MPPRAVSVSLKELQDGTVPFSTLEEAFGATSLGVIIVRDLPSRFVALRHRLLSSSSYLGNLPGAELVKLESPASKYLVGWSCGKETLKDGRYDSLKGSFYVNCAPGFEESGLQTKIAAQYPSYPEYTAPNIWPSLELLPDFEKVFRELCTLIIDTAVLVAQACDRYAQEHIEGYRKGYLEHIVRTSVSTKARLLHYFPSLVPSRVGVNDVACDAADDDWCGTHIDHGCLTGLTSAMFVDEAAHPPKLDLSSSTDSRGTLEELTSAPDPRAGLYIHSRAGEVTQVGIPRDCLGFQTGQALEIITQGHFKAVPHFVRGTAPTPGQSVARNTLAVFTQPNLWEDVGDGRDFATFAREIVERNH